MFLNQLYYCAVRAAEFNISLDHLVGLQEDRWRDDGANRLGGLKVDHHLELGRLLYWKVGGPGPLQDFVDIGRAEAPLIVMSPHVGAPQRPAFTSIWRHESGNAPGPCRDPRALSLRDPRSRFSLVLAPGCWRQIPWPVRAARNESNGQWAYRGPLGSI